MVTSEVASARLALSLPDHPGQTLRLSVALICDPAESKDVAPVRYPIAEARGLCLYSTATQKGDLSALASLHDTSRKSEDFTGRSDKTPVLIQNLPEKERSPLCTLFYPGSGSMPASLFRNPVSSLGGQSASRLSLLGLASGWWLCHLTLQSALAQGQYSTSVLRQKLAKWLGM